MKGISTVEASPTENNQTNQPFTAEYSINSIETCGPACKNVNVTVKVTNTLGEEVEFPQVMMSAYVIDNGTEFLWFETEDKRIEIWSDSEWPDNISAGETLIYTRDFNIGASEGIDIVFKGDWIVFGEVVVDNGDILWNVTKKIHIQSGQCADR